MFRRSIFLGLMIVLGAVLTYLVLNARKEEKQTVVRPTEIVRVSKPSPTRVLSPADLEIVQVIAVPAQTETAVSPSAAKPARYVVTIRNRGQVAYGRFSIKLGQNDADRSEEDQGRELSELVPPGATVALPEIVMEGKPGRPANMRAHIQWADLAGTEAPSVVAPK